MTPLPISNEAYSGRMTRNERLLARIDVTDGNGLEIGALCSPVVPPDHLGINYVDHLDTAGLRKKYEHDPHVDIERIVPVRFVWSGGPLLDIVGGDRFSYVIASHVVEHVPDLIGWLKHIARVLKPGGVLGLVVPDMRYTFDCQRNLTAMPELLEAYLGEYRCPSIRQVLDHFIHKVEVPEQCAISSLWANPEARAKVSRSRPNLLQELGESGLRKHFEDIRKGDYIDSHCSVFTPGSFVRLIAEMSSADLCYFTVRHLEPTLPNEQDFLVILESLPSDIASHDDREFRHRFILERLPGIETL